MADKFVSFHTHSIRGLLADRKTQSRRALRPYEPKPGAQTDPKGLFKPRDRCGPAANFYHPHRFEVGDRLWVKEDWRTFVSLDGTDPSEVWSKDQERGAGVAYVAGGGLSIMKSTHEYLFNDARGDLSPFGKVRARMFMPKWVSRLTLVVTEVRVQRLLDISEVDAIAEGIEPVYDDRSPGETFWKDYETYQDGTPHAHAIVPYTSPIASYRSLWEEINGRGSWSENPWVAAYTFTVIKNNIERIAA